MTKDSVVVLTYPSERVYGKIGLVVSEAYLGPFKFIKVTFMEDKHFLEGIYVSKEYVEYIGRL